jgi:hypothetical protein
MRALTLIILSFFLAGEAHAKRPNYRGKQGSRELDRKFRGGRGGFRRGNENSKRIPPVRQRQEAYAGNGCPANTMRVVFAPDQLSFSILFDQFIAEASGAQRRIRDDMRCNLILTIEIPENTQMEITRVDLRGFVNLPQRSRAKLSSAFNFVGPGGDRDKMVLDYMFAGPLTENYEISSDVLNPEGSAPDSEVSPCGGPVRLAIQNQLSLAAPGQSEEAMITLDSIDGGGEAIYHVNWRDCRP